MVPEPAGTDDPTENGNNSGEENGINKQDNITQTSNGSRPLKRRTFVRGTIASSVAAGTLPAIAGEAEAAVTNISNENLTLYVEDSSGVGTFTMETADGRDLLYGNGQPATSYLTVRVDGTNYVTAPGNTGQNSTLMGQYVSRSPTSTGSGQAIETEWVLPENVVVTQTISLAGKAVKFTVNVENRGTQEHTVQLRYLFDYQVDQQDGAPIFVNGEVLTAETRFNSPSFGTWQTYDQLPEPNLTGKGTIETQPDVIDFVEWEDAFRSPYEYNHSGGPEEDSSNEFYTPDNTSSPASDSAGLLYWELGSLEPSKETAITTYYGSNEPERSEIAEVKQSLEQFETTATNLLSTTVEAKARTHAKLYKKAGSAYRDNLTNYFGQKAGIDEAGPVDPDIKDELDKNFEQSDLSESRVESGTRELYLFFDEMFAAVDQGDNVDEIQSVFVEHLWGRATGQQHTLTVRSSMTLNDLRLNFKDEFGQQASAVIDTLRRNSPTEATISNLTKFIGDKEARISSYTEAMDRFHRNVVSEIQKGNSVKTYQQEIQVTNGASSAEQAEPESQVSLLPVHTEQDATMHTSQMVTPSASVLGFLVGGGVLLKGFLGSAAGILGSAAGKFTLAGGVSALGVLSLSGGNLGLLGGSVSVYSSASAWAVPTANSWFMYQNSYYYTKLQRLAIDRLQSQLEETTEQYIKDHYGLDIEIISSLSKEELTITLVEILLERVVKEGANWVEEAFADVRVTDISAPDIGSDDIVYEGYSRVARGTATVTVENPSSTAVTPYFIPDETEVTAYSFGGAIPLGIPVSAFVLTPDPASLPEIPPDSSTDIDISYFLPLDFLPGVYRLSVGVKSDPFSRVRSTASDWFYDNEFPSINVNQIMSGVINQGGSEQFQTTPAEDIARAAFSLTYGGSDLDLHLYDANDNHTGVNYDTGELENEVPRATWSGPDRGVGRQEGITVSNPSESYTTEVVAVETSDRGTGYTTSVTETTELPLTIQVLPNRARVESSPGETGRTRITVEEVAGFSGTDNLTLSAERFSHGESDAVINPSNVSFNENNITLAPNGSASIHVVINIPQDVTTGIYNSVIRVATPDTVEEVPIELALSQADDEERAISISERSDQSVDYQFSTSGSLKRSTTNDATIDLDDLVVDNTAYGSVQGGTDSYRFSGDLTTFDINRGSVTVTIDGDEANIDDLIAEPEGSGDLPNLISISGRGPDGPLDYQFSVSGEVEHDRANDATIDPEDLIAGGTAYGQVEGGTDSYRYSGDITAFDVDQGDTTVLVNGEETDISALPPEPTEDSDLPNVITIDDESRDGPLEYQFEVSGELSHSTANSATIDPGDLVVGTTAYGLVNGGRDSFRFSGQIADFAIDQGKRRVLVNGNEVENPEGEPS